jgi:hypothetical protein
MRLQYTAVRAMIPVMALRKNWTPDDLLVAFRLYCRTPFGRLHRNNPEIIELARLMGRTPSSVGMKACNFASLDPAQQARKSRCPNNIGNAAGHLVSSRSVSMKSSRKSQIAWRNAATSSAPRDNVPSSRSQTLPTHPRLPRAT